MGRKSVMLNLRDVTLEHIHSQEVVNQKLSTETFGSPNVVVDFRRSSSQGHLLLGIENNNSLLAPGAAVDD